MDETRGVQQRRGEAGGDVLLCRPVLKGPFLYFYCLKTTVMVRDGLKHIDLHISGQIQSKRPLLLEYYFFSGSYSIQMVLIFGINDGPSVPG